jgi:hypothetical protein
MRNINTFAYQLDKSFTIEQLRTILSKYESQGATHLELCVDNDRELIVELFKEVEEQEKTIPVTYATIRRNIGWSEFAKVTGGNVYAINEGANFEDSHIFWVTSDQAEELRI